jgi:N12 class adenine-specific DNA methylase
MEGERTGEFRLQQGDDKRFEMILAEKNAVGKIQAVNALGARRDLVASTLGIMVSLLGDRDADLVSAATLVIKNHASIQALDALVKALPVDRVSIKEAGKADKAKLEAIMAVLESAEGIEEKPDFGVDGVLWQRWLKENRDKIQFRN